MYLCCVVCWFQMEKWTIRGNPATHRVGLGFGVVHNRHSQIGFYDVLVLLYGTRQDTTVIFFLFLFSLFPFDR